MDLIAGDTKGQVWLFLNEGTDKAPVLAEGVRVEAGGKPIVGKEKKYKQVDGRYVVDKVIPGSHELAEIYSKLHMADWTGDGLKDLLIGYDNKIVVYRNSGAPGKPKFEDPVKIEAPGGTFPSRPAPYVVDWDGDSKMDLLVGTEGSEVFFYRNEGTNAAPVLARGKDLGLKGDGYDDSYRCRIDVVDWNGDGIRDLLVGTAVSGPDDETVGNIWLFLGK